jgi:hypothetical protein
MKFLKSRSNKSNCEFHPSISNSSAKHAKSKQSARETTNAVRTGRKARPKSYLNRRVFRCFTRTPKFAIATALNHTVAKIIENAIVGLCNWQEIPTTLLNQIAVC